MSTFPFPSIKLMVPGSFWADTRSLDLSEEDARDADSGTVSTDEQMRRISAAGEAARVRLDEAEIGLPYRKPS